ncbi:MAG TPA: hypothetical protein VFJ71_11930 [Candidatus Limnocylindrales bacterium]|nr:hypothetical protein [Candidatus Limnocylindrales bacterium]
MQVISSSRSARPPIGAVLVGLVVGSILVAGGVFLGWVVFATPVLTGLSPAGGRSTAGQMAIGALVWGFALVAPASFAIVGALRLGRVARAVTAKPAPRATTRLAGLIGDEYTCATDVRLPDGRLVRNLILGPFGMAVLSELPPARAMRHQGMSWEVRGPNGRWQHFEHPLERTARDAERVRRWTAAVERDFVVKVYSAVITDDPTIARTPACAAIGPNEVPAWLASLPPARALTPDRRADLTEEVRALL